MIHEITQWIPSCAVVPQERGAEFIGVIDDADWSLGQGFHRGFCSSFHIRAGKAVWFHFPITTPAVVNGAPMALHELMLLWQVTDGAQLYWVTAQHGGMERMELTEAGAPIATRPEPFDVPEEMRERMAAFERRSSVFAFPEPLKLRFGVQLCVLIRCERAAGNVRFYGAGARFAAVEDSSARRVARSEFSEPDCSRGASGA